jgi:S-(hydroxymethyl)glutathione dehydrogenase/alcohol dehydrogenase
VTRAVVARSTDAPVGLEEVELAPTGAGQVRVRLRAAGVCHSDLSIATGALPHPMPVVLGHEGAGEVVEVGEGVTHVRAGDHVVLTWTPACGECFFCARNQPYLCERATPDSFAAPYATEPGLRPGLGAATWAEETLVLGRGVVPLEPSVPFDVAALVGCAVTTGVGAVVTTARVEAGSSVVVIGCGGVGLSVLLGARVAGAATIVAVDPSAEKRELALSMGATHALDGDNLVAAVRELTGGRGADYTFEAVGRAATMQSAWRAARRGGHVTVVGAGRRDDPVTLPAFDLSYSAKTLHACWYGSSDPARDFPHILGLYAEGALDLDALIDRHIELAEVPAAMERMAAGEGARSVVVFP